jgi:hypothetical protein
LQLPAQPTAAACAGKTAVLPDSLGGACFLTMFAQEPPPARYNKL